MSDQPRPTPRTDERIRLDKKMRTSKGVDNFTLGQQYDWLASFSRELERESDARVERIAELERENKAFRNDAPKGLPELLIKLRRADELESENAKLREALEWRPIETAPKDYKSGKFLVTNNLGSRDAFGNMSHLWLVAMVHEEGGRFVAFDGDRWHKVENLTHWSRGQALAGKEEG